MAGESGVVHRALDGTSYHIAGEFDLTMPFTSVVEVNLGGRLVEFTSGTATLGEDLAEALGAAGEPEPGHAHQAHRARSDEQAGRPAPTRGDEELHYRGGLLRLTPLPAYDHRIQLVENSTLVTWRGERYALVTRLYHVSVADVLALLRPLGFDERADGLTIVPNPEAGAGFAGPAAVIKEVPGVGLLEMAAAPGGSSGGSSGRSSGLRREAGRILPTGELFQDTLSDGRPFFLLAGEGVRSTVLPLAGCDPRHLSERLGRLRIAKGELAWIS